jgi:peptidoglycan biosynthesis protein MviN/MurJ (putative lipid II flippase)
MLVSLGTVLVNLVVASTLVKVAGLGHLGLALSTSANALFGAVALAAMLRARIGGIEGRALAASAAKIVAASASMGLVCAASSHTVLALLGVSRMAHLADSLFSSGIGALVFLGLCRTLRVRELAPAWDACATWRAKIF